MKKQSVLFVCVHNSARSQIAEEILRKIAGDRFDVESAGLEAGTLNPYAVEALKEIGIDISGKKTQTAFDLFKSGRYYSYVITVCDEASAERCPLFPRCVARIHWSFPDPSKFTGTDEEIMARVREVRDSISDKVAAWVVAVERENAKENLKAV